MKLLRTEDWAMLSILLVYSFIPAFGGLARALELVGGPAIMPQNLRALAAPAPIIVHVLSSFVFCIFGALQFLHSLRSRHPKVHRVLGCVVILAGFASAASGMWMTHLYAFPAELQGGLLYWARMTVGSLMIGLIVRALIAIRSHDISRHGASMLRAYALGQGASTQSILGIGWIVAFGTEPQGFERDGLMVSAWVLNLCFAELLLLRLVKLNKLMRITPLRLSVGRAYRDNGSRSATDRLRVGMPSRSAAP